MNKDFYCLAIFVMKNKFYFFILFFFFSSCYSAQVNHEINLSYVTHEQVMRALDTYKIYPIEEIDISHLSFPKNPGSGSNREKENRSMEKIIAKLKTFKNSLKRLSINECDLAYVRLTALGTLKKIEELSLSDCDLRNIPNCLTKLSKLKELDLSDNEIAAKNIKRLRKITRKNKKLQVLNLEDNDTLTYGLSQEFHGHKEILNNFK